MTLNQSALLELTQLLRAADGGEVMRQRLGFMLQAFVDAEATSVIGAALTSGPKTASPTATAPVPRPSPRRRVT